MPRTTERAARRDRAGRLGRAGVDKRVRSGAEEERADEDRRRTHERARPTIVASNRCERADDKAAARWCFDVDSGRRRPQQAGRDRPRPRARSPRGNARRTAQARFAQTARARPNRAPTAQIFSGSVTCACAAVPAPAARGQSRDAPPVPRTARAPSWLRRLVGPRRDRPAGPG